MVFRHRPGLATMTPNGSSGGKRVPLLLLAGSITVIFLLGLNTQRPCRQYEPARIVRLEESGITSIPGSELEDPEYDCTQETLAAAEVDPLLNLEKTCAATPWLLPPRTAGLSYSGVTDEEALLALRAAPQGRYERAVSLFGFTRDWAVLAQNYVYSLVRFAGVTNYIAMTWDPDDYAACLDLNLPCWDTTRFIPWESKREDNQEARFNTPDYNAITWMKPRVLAHLIEKGYVVHISDVDVAYAAKPLWASYLRYIEDGGADAAMANEAVGGANTGNYVMLPTPGGRAFSRAWGDSATVYNHTNDQFALQRLAKDTGGRSHAFCSGVRDCAAAAANRSNLSGSGGGDSAGEEAGRVTALIRHYEWPWVAAFRNACYFKRLGNVRRHPLDACHWTMLYVHTVCVRGSADKAAAMAAAGFWFLDCAPGRAEGGSGPPRCAPLRWRQPGAEERVRRCRAFRELYPLAFTYIPLGGESSGGSGGEEAQEQ